MTIGALQPRHPSRQLPTLRGIARAEPARPVVQR